MYPPQILTSLISTRNHSLHLLEALKKVLHRRLIFVEIARITKFLLKYFIVYPKLSTTYLPVNCFSSCGNNKLERFLLFRKFFLVFFALSVMNLKTLLPVTLQGNTKIFLSFAFSRARTQSKRILCNRQA